MNILFRDLSLIHPRHSGRIRLGVFYFEKEEMKKECQRKAMCQPFQLRPLRLYSSRSKDTDQPSANLPGWCRKAEIKIREQRAGGRGQRAGSSGQKAVSGNQK
jgi:hypothetical protein